MLTVGFVVTPGFPVMSLAALSVFEFANTSTERPLYDVRVLSEHGGPIATCLGTELATTAFGDAHCDTLIIGGNTRIVPTSPGLLAFVAAAANSSRRVASICTGTFALGDAGLLDGRRVTTHWLFTEQLKLRFPQTRLEPNRLFVVDGSIWTAAGNSAGIDLTLCMLEQDYGPDLALAVARILVVDYQRAGGQPQHSALLELHRSPTVCRQPWLTPGATCARRYPSRTSPMSPGSARASSAAPSAPRPAPRPPRRSKASGSTPRA